MWGLILPHIKANPRLWQGHWLRQGTSLCPRRRRLCASLRMKILRNGTPADRMYCASRQDIEWRPVGDGVPDLGDRRIAHRDASLGPILDPNRRIVRAVVAWQTVNEDAVAGLDMHCPRLLAVLCIGIGDVQFACVSRALRPPIDAIDAFRRAAVTRFALRPLRMGTERHRKGLKHLAIAQQLEDAAAFDHHHPVGQERFCRRRLDGGGRRRWAWRSATARQSQWQDENGKRKRAKDRLTHWSGSA